MPDQKMDWELFERLLVEDWLCWDDHPGYIIGKLNGRLAAHGIQIETQGVGDKILVRLVAAEEKGDA